jgi:hypothetical protein
MVRRLLSACVAIALAVPASIAAPPPKSILYQLRPTARRTLAGSLLFGIHPALSLLPTDKALDAPCDHPAPVDDFLVNVPKRLNFGVWTSAGCTCAFEDIEWWKWFLSFLAERDRVPPPEQNEGYIQCFEPKHFIEGLTPAGVLTNDLNIPIVLADEPLPMPHEDDEITCPYLRQKMAERRTAQAAEPEIGRDVLDNLERLKEADKLVDLAKELAGHGLVTEAMTCCDRAAELCPGSPCAARAVEVLLDLARGIDPPAKESEESAEPRPEEPAGPCSQWDSFCREFFAAMGLPVKDVPGEDLKQMEAEWERIWFTDMPSRLTPERIHGGLMPGDEESSEPGVEEMVNGLMKACHLLVSQGMHQQAAELARQAYALDPQRVLADPLIYKMHLIAETPATQPAGTNETSEPQTCPYCPRFGKPIHEIVPQEKKNDGDDTSLVPPLPPVDAEVVPALDRLLTETAEALTDSLGVSPPDVVTNADGNVSLSAECCVGKSVYHLRYDHGCLKIWGTPDAGQSPP